MDLAKIAKVKPLNKKNRADGILPPPRTTDHTGK